MKMDADKDGKVTAGEMDASHAAMKNKAHTVMKDQSKDSTSHDGKHVREMSSAQKMPVIDADSDGAITAGRASVGLAAHVRQDGHERRRRPVEGRVPGRAQENDDCGGCRVA